MNPLRLAAVLSFGVMLPVTGTAQVITPVSVCQPAVVVYGNGVANDQDDAASSAEALEIRLRSRLGRGGSSPDGLTFTYSLNPTDGKFDDLLQANRQLGNLLTARQLVEILTKNALTPAQRAVFELAYQQSLARALAVDSGRVTEHATRYINYIQRGYRVVVVAHSQGNLHANQAALHFLTSEDTRRHFSIMAVASPDSMTQLWKREHVTILGDRVHWFFPGSALPKNTDSPPVDFMGHNFVETYLKSGSLAEGLILGGALGTIHELAPSMLVPTSTTLAPPTAPISADGQLTFTATVTANCPAPPAVAPPPTGTVSFKRNGSTICAAVPLAAGQATCTTSFPSADQYTMVAEYAGDALGGLAASSASAIVDVVPGPVDFVVLPGELFVAYRYELYPIFAGPPGPYDCSWSSPVWGPNPLVSEYCSSGARGPWGASLGAAGAPHVTLSVSLRSTGQVIGTVTKPVLVRPGPGVDFGDVDYRCVDNLWVDANGYLNHGYVVDITAKTYLPKGASAYGMSTANITSCGGWRIEVLDGKTVCHRDAGLEASSYLTIHDEQRFHSGLLVTSIMAPGQNHFIQNGSTYSCTVMPPT